MSKIHVSKFNSVDAPGRYQYYNDPKMSDKEREEINSAFENDKNKGVIISTRPAAHGPSQALMEQKLKMYIRAGLVVDKNDDGEVDKFSNKNKRSLGKEFETIHKEKGYTTDFTHIAEDTEFYYTWDEFCRFVDAAGYKFKEPAAPKDAKAPDNKPDEAGKQAPAPVPEPPTPVPPTPKSEKKQEQEKPDTVILDSTTWTDENGNVIADDTRALVNGQPYHSRTGFNTFGTLDPEHVDWRQYSQSELDKMETPTGAKITTEPDALPKQAAKDKPLVTAPPVEEAPVAQTPVAEAPVAEAPKKLDIKQLEMPTGSLTKTQTEFSTASDKLKNIPMPQPSPKETDNQPTDAPVAKTPVVNPQETPVTPASSQKTDTQPTATATPKANTPNAKTEFENMVNSDPQLANRTDKERAEILKTKVSNIETEISNLQQPTVVYKKRLFGTKKILTTGEQNAQINKKQIAKLEQELDTAKRNSTYANAVAGNTTGFGATSLVDKNGNTLASYPQYTTVKYRDANGQESNVAKVKTYNKTTHKNDISYYPFDVQKVNDIPTRKPSWQAVPDMKNELTGGEEIRN